MSSAGVPEPDAHGQATLADADTQAEVDVMILDYLVCLAIDSSLSAESQATALSEEAEWQAQAIAGKSTTQFPDSRTPDRRKGSNPSWPRPSIHCPRTWTSSFNSSPCPTTCGVTPLPSLVSIALANLDWRGSELNSWTSAPLQNPRSRKLGGLKPVPGSWHKPH